MLDIDRSIKEMLKSNAPSVSNVAIQRNQLVGRRLPSFGYFSFPKMTIPKIPVMKNLMGDKDGDRVRNIMDCNPFDKRRQGGEQYWEELKKKNILISADTPKQSKMIRREFERNPELLSKAEGTVFVVGDNNIFSETGHEATYLKPNEDIKRDAIQHNPYYKGPGDAIVIHKDAFKKNRENELNKMIRHELSHKEDYYKNPKLYDKEVANQARWEEESNRKLRTDMTKIGLVKGKYKQKEDVPKHIWKQAVGLIREEDKRYYSFPGEARAKQAEQVIPERKLQRPREEVEKTYREMYGSDTDKDGLPDGFDCNPNNPNKQGPLHKADIITVYHGTRQKNWEKIKKEGMAKGSGYTFTKGSAYYYADPYKNPDYKEPGDDKYQFIYPQAPPAGVPEYDKKTRTIYSAKVGVGEEYGPVVVKATIPVSLLSEQTRTDLRQKKLVGKVNYDNLNKPQTTVLFIDKPVPPKYLQEEDINKVRRAMSKENLDDYPEYQVLESLSKTYRNLMADKDKDGVIAAADNNDNNPNNPSGAHFKPYSGAFATWRTWQTW